MRIVDNFLTKFPEQIVTFSGSDNRRTRSYRIVISRELNSISERFQMLGQLRSGQIENFQPNKDYKQFYIRFKA